MIFYIIIEIIGHKAHRRQVRVLLAFRK